VLEFVCFDGCGVIFVVWGLSCYLKKFECTNPYYGGTLIENIATHTHLLQTGETNM